MDPTQAVDVDMFGNDIEPDTNREPVKAPTPTDRPSEAPATLAAMDAERAEHAAARDELCRAPYAPEPLETRFAQHEPIDREAIAAQVAEIERANEGKPASAI